MIQLTVNFIVDGSNDSIEKKYRFPPSISILDATKEIRERYPGDSGKDYALFLPDPIVEVDDPKEKKKKDKKKKKDDEPEKPKARTGIWLRINRTLESYDIASGDTVWFRKKHRVIKAKTADEASKSVIVDLSQPVKDVIAKIGAKYGLEVTDEYAIQFEGSKRWLKNAKTLTEQGDPDQVIVLKKRFYVNDSKLDPSQAVQLHLSYIQGRESIVEGNHPVTRDEAVMFAALQAQAEVGPFNPETRKHGLGLDLNRFLAPQFLKQKDIETAILNQWKALGTMSTLDAKYKYHQLCMTLRTYGTTIFAININVAKPPKKADYVPYKLGFTAEKIIKYQADAKVILKEYKYTTLRKWVFTDHDITLDFGEYEEGGPMVCVTPQGEEIASLIAGYIDILVRTTKALGKKEEETGETAQIRTRGHARGRVAVGMTVSTSGDSAAGVMQEIADITDLGGLRQAFQHYTVPELEDLEADVSKTSLTFEQLTAQMSSNAGGVEGFLSQLIAAATAHDQHKLVDLSKSLGMAVTSILQNARAGAQVTKRGDQKMFLIEASKALLAALNGFTDALMAYEKDPSEQNRVQLEAAQAAFNKATIAIQAAMRFEPAADSSLGTMLLELAQNLAGAISDMVAEARTACPGDAELENLCCACEIEGQRLAQSMGYLGPYMNDTAVRAKVVEEANALQGRCTHVAQVARTRGSEPLALRAEELEMSMGSLSRAIALPGYDIDPEMLPYLRASYIALEESAIIASEPQNAEAVARSAEAIKDTVGVLIDHAKKVGETNADGSGERMFEYSRQIALATKALVTESESATPNYENLAQAAMDVNATVNAMIGDDMLAMHKVVLIDRSKQACTDALHATVAARAAARAPARGPTDRKALVDAALAAQRAIAGLLDSVSGAVGHEGDERVNVSSLAAQAGSFCEGISLGFFEPVRAVECEAEVYQALEGAELSAAALSQETQIFRTVGRLADIEFATERFHAAESVLLATIFANDANKLKPVGTRAEVMEVLPQAAARFGTALKAIAQAVKAGEPFIDALVDLSAATQDIMVSSRTLVSNSRFKHERETIIDASKQLSADVGLLIEGLKRVARDDMEGTVEGIAQAIGGSVGALQRIVALAQQEGGALHLEAGELGNAGPEADAELEAEANQCLIDAKAEIDNTIQHLEQVEQVLAQSGEDDTRAQVRKAILDSVKALVTSTGVVVNSSCEAQAELVAALNVPSTRANYARDPSLAEGLCGAANQVLISVRDLTRGIDPDTIDTISQKEIAEHAESVSKAVEILAAAVRAGIKGGSQKLIDAARAVSEACMQLLEVAKMIDDMPDEKVEENEENFGIDSFTMKEIEIQMQIAELESKLAKAKKKYDRLMNTKTQTAWNSVN